MVQNDARSAGSFLSGDWVIVASGGSLTGKERFLELVASGELTYSVMETRNLEVRVHGETAVAVACRTSAGQYRGQPFLLEERCTCVFVKQAGRWLCVLTHLSPLVDERAGAARGSGALQRVVPALRVRSYDKSSAFYAKLGFQEEWRHQFAPHLPVFASVARADMRLFLTEHAGDCQFGGLVHFYVDDVDRCYEEFRAAGVVIQEPPANSLGPDIRDMLVEDPDGNRLSFITLAKKLPALTGVPA